MNDTIELINVKKVIQSKEIIKDISFSVARGEVFGFLGPNGAGKTTVIRMLVNLIRPSEGTIRICGCDLKTDRKQAMNKIGAIIEQPELYGYMSGYSNLKHYANMNRNTITHERIMEIASIVNIEKSLKQKVKTYSLGMRQRLGLAQALLHKPDILILDEPTNGLDPNGIREFRKYIRHLAETYDMTIMISSHLLSEIELMCDRVGIIEHGKLIELKDLKAGAISSNQKFRMKISDSKLASELLNMKGYLHKKLDSHILELSTHEHIMPEIIQEFSAHHIKIYWVTPITATLEDHYFSTLSASEGM
ncbi:ABC transporter ATP-binding protein [Rossellomorea marisflavi]|uniref:ABC transporter ATP-binding protein n=1 Tax=Rossellomorea marisflavi TaxID=189381 RepID=UPI00279F3274|nr:ABC transporter ATP-binding protein [Rossellomorea marisflavi]UTE73448.1 ABC transporter ATP-binding protein [Rossellomorea marisflavi]